MRHYYCKKSRRSSMLLLSTMAFIDFFMVFVAAELTAVVNTTTGPVQGEILTSVNSLKYAAFKGIRYAKPPLGYLRFKPPVPIDPWTETLNAIVDGDDCIQVNSITGVVAGSEDCLYLNVITPMTDMSNTSTNLKSVMVWIYGGGFTTGSSSTELYRPDYLIDRDVVFVAFNYRIGALGFLSLIHPNATGNAGLKDQVLALKWVKENIEKFGGHPNNVTIFGQSAGSAAVGYHVISDASVGLFQGAISMSGVPLNPWALHTPGEALFRAYQLGALLGTPSVDKETLLRTFYNATAKQLVLATSNISLAILPFAPTLEDKTIATDVFLTKCALVKYTTGNYTKVPQMLGFTDQETLAFAAYVQPVFDIINETLRMIDDYGLNLPSNLSVVKTLINSSTNLFDVIGDTAVQAFVNETTALLFTAQIDQTQQLLAKNNGKPVYYYHISFFTNTSLHNLYGNNSLLGAAHADDLAYIFYLPIANYSSDPMDPTRRTINRVSTMWTNFAKYGNPTPTWVDDDSIGITWPNSGLLGRALDIGTELKVESRPTNAYTKLVQAASLPTLGKANGCFSRESLL